MFRKFARFRLFQSRDVSGRRNAMPANDNLPSDLRFGARRRLRPRVLACRWSVTTGEKRLSCRWQIDTLTQTVLEDPDPGLPRHQIFRPRAIRFGRKPRNRTVLAAVAKLSSDDAIQQHRQCTFLQLRIACNKD
jgi:hypothetical protein